MHWCSLRSFEEISIFIYRQEYISLFQSSPLQSSQASDETIDAPTESIGNNIVESDSGVAGIPSPPTSPSVAFAPDTTERSRHESSSSVSSSGVGGGPPMPVPTGELNHAFRCGDDGNE